MRTLHQLLRSPVARYTAGALSVILMLGVMVASTHTKDVMGFALGYGMIAETSVETLKKTVDTSNSPDPQQQQKVTADLHNHTDKLSLKSLTKNVSDDTNRAQNRDNQRSKKNRLSQMLDPEPGTIRDLFARALCLKA